MRLAAMSDCVTRTYVWRHSRAGGCKRHVQRGREGEIQHGHAMREAPTQRANERHQLHFTQEHGDERRGGDRRGAYALVDVQLSDASRVDVEIRRFEGGRHRMASD